MGRPWVDGVTCMDALEVLPLLKCCHFGSAANPDCSRLPSLGRTLGACARSRRTLLGPQAWCIRGLSKTVAFVCPLVRMMSSSLTLRGAPLLLCKRRLGGRVLHLLHLSPKMPIAGVLCPAYAALPPWPPWSTTRTHLLTVKVHHRSLEQSITAETKARHQMPGP